MKIKGIGQAKSTALFKHFKTMSAIKSASIEELLSVKELQR